VRPGMALMDGDNAPKYFHDEAAQGWVKLDNQDPRSWDYLLADRSVSGGIAPDHVITSKLAMKWANLLFRYESLESPPRRLASVQLGSSGRGVETELNFGRRCG
jgi:hypothetical protein